MFEFLPGANAADIQPVKQKPIADALAERKQEREQAAKIKDSTTVWDGIGAAQGQGTIGTVHRFVESLGFDPVKGYTIPTDREQSWKERGIPAEQWELFGRAVSDEHLDWLEHLAVQNMESDKTLAQFGFLGQLALGMTDPGMAAIDAAAAPLAYGAKVGRLANALRSGAVAGATAAGTEFARSTFDPTVELEDMAYAAGASFALGGAFGARKGGLYEPNPYDPDPDVVMRLARDENLSAAKVDGVTPDPTPGVPPLRNETPTQQDRIDRALTNAHLQPAFGSIRRDLSARLGNAQSALVREAGRQLFRDGVGYTDRTTAVQESATEFSKRHLATLETRWRTGVNAAWSAYRARTGTRRWDFETRRQFNDEVGRAVRGETMVSPEARTAADAVRETMRQVLRLAQASGLDGFDNVRTNANYLPRYWSAAGFRRMFGEHGLTFEQVRDGVVVPAIRRAWDTGIAGAEGIDTELVAVVADSYLKRAQANFEGDGMALLVRPLDSEAVDELAEMLRDAGVPAGRMANLLTRLQSQADEAGKLDRAKRRIDLDETFATTLTNEAGERVTVRMSDLFDNDVEVVMSRYLREITGWAALSSKTGIRNRAQLERYVSDLKTDAGKAGDDVADVARLVDIGLKATFGRSTELAPASKASRYGHFLRQWNFARVMNQVGFSLFAELGPTIAHAGLRNFWESARILPDLIKRGTDGKLATREAQVLEELFAPGTDWLRNPPFMRLDDDALAPPTFGNNRLGVAADNALNAATHVTSVMSGMAPLNVLLQRVAGRATMLRLLDMANATKLSRAETARLRSWGLDAKSQDELFGHLKGKTRIDQLDTASLPFDLRERMAAFLFRVTRHQVLDGEASDSIELMHGVVGRIVMQFRTFMVGSYARHFLNSVHHYDDWRTYMMVTLSAAFAGAGWTARTYLNTIGDEQKRRELLTAENVYKNAVAQSSWSAVVPVLVDTAWDDLHGAAVFGQEVRPVFAGNRSTGLNNGISGIPSVDLAAKVWDAKNLPAIMADPDAHLTEKQMRDFWRVLWFNNMTGVRNIADEAFSEMFPED